MTFDASTAPARALALALAVREASRALTALYLELPEVIVSDVKEKVTRAFAAYDMQLDAVRGDVEHWKEMYESAERCCNAVVPERNQLQADRNALQARVTELESHFANKP